MTTLVLTLVGDDRSGLVAAVAEVVAAHDGNWERSQLAELAGTFAGVVQVSVPDLRADELRRALAGIEGLAIASHGAAGRAEPGTGRELRIDVLGNDRPGIVREVAAALHTQGVSIESMTTESRDAAMAGGVLFEAQAIARVSDDFEVDGLRAALEGLASEIQVDISLL